MNIIYASHGSCCSFVIWARDTIVAAWLRHSMDCLIIVPFSWKGMNHLAFLAHVATVSMVLGCVSYCWSNSYAIVSDITDVSTITVSRTTTTAPPYIMSCRIDTTYKAKN